MGRIEIFIWKENKKKNVFWDFWNTVWQILNNKTGPFEESLGMCCMILLQCATLVLKWLIFIFFLKKEKFYELWCPLKQDTAKHSMDYGRNLSSCHLSLQQQLSFPTYSFFNGYKSLVRVTSSTAHTQNLKIQLCSLLLNKKSSLSFCLY